LALEQKERRGIWEATAAAAVASFSLSPTSFVFFCYLANFVKPPKPATPHPQQKKSFFSVVKIPVIAYTQTKTTSAFPLSLSLSLSLPQNKRKGAS
jgi:hypothetical protein